MEQLKTELTALEAKAVGTWKAHAGWILIVLVLAVSSYVVGRSWLAEHDARMLADQQIKIDEVKVKALDKQLADGKDRIVQLEKDRQSIAADYSKRVSALEKKLAEAKTPQQAADQLALPLVNSTDVQIPALQLLGERASCQITGVQLEGCKKELAKADEQVAQSKANVAVAEQKSATKDDEIKALKKKPSLWKRMKSAGAIGAIAVVAVEAVRIYLGRP